MAIHFVSTAPDINNHGHSSVVFTVLFFILKTHCQENTTSHHIYMQEFSD